MTSRMRLYEIAESSHAVLNPVTLDKLMLVGEILRLTPDHRVLDLCSGKAEMLSQWAARFGCAGHGVDVSEVFLSAARARAAELGVGERVTFSQGDAEDFRTDERYDVVSCLGGSWFAGGIAESLQVMQGWVRPDGALVLGDCFWSREPSDEVRARIGAAYPTLPGLLDLVEGIGLEVVEMVLSDPDGWDRYRAAQWTNLYAFLRDHPDDPDAETVRERLVRGRRTYVEAERDHVGWGVFVLRPALSQVRADR